MAATSYLNKFPSYCKMVSHAKNLAKRSILIDHGGLEHIDLNTNFANIEHVYQIEKENRRGHSRLSLIEFKSVEDADRVASSARHVDGLLPISLKILRYNGRLARSLDDHKTPFPVEKVRLSSERQDSLDFNSYTDLISNNMMSLVALKLRFVTLVNFEKILCSGIFDNYELMPFGSSVTDMASESGDLDLVVTRRLDHHQEIINSFRNMASKAPESGFHATASSNRIENQSTQLVHLDKSIYSETKDNSGFRGAMRWFDHVLREYMPLTDGFGVLCLHRAKVPIIKFTSRVTNIDCDLSFDLGLDYRELESNSTVPPGIMMTEILYSLCRNNNLITALVIYLRIYAKLNSITSKVSGIGMTNFQFLSLVIFFLQQTALEKVENATTPYLPSSPEAPSQGDIDACPSKFVGRKYRYEFRPLKRRRNRSMGQRNDNEHNDDPIRPLFPSFKDIFNGGSLYDDSGVNVQQHYDEDELNEMLPGLIMRFFRFYSSFDFDRYSLNLLESSRDKKLDNSVLYVMNPLEPNRNICHNVNRKGLEQLVKQVRESCNYEVGSRSYIGEAVPARDPLHSIRKALLKYKKQVKKGRTLLVSDEDDFLVRDNQRADYYGRTNEIARDVCR